MLEREVLSLSYCRIVVKPQNKRRGLTPESFETYQCVFPGDVVLRTTDLQNDQTSLRVGAVKTEGIITSAYLRLIARGSLMPEFAYLVLHAYDVMKILYGYGSGLRQTLDFDHMKRIPIAVPSIPEQVAIASFFRHVDSRIRKFIETKEGLIDLLEEGKRAIILRAVTRGVDPGVSLRPSNVDWIGDMPVHWDLRPLKWASRLQRGYDLPAESRLTGSIPVISSGGIVGAHAVAGAKGPGVVIGRYGSTGSVFYADGDFWPHNTALFVTDFYCNDPRWVFHLQVIPKAKLAGKSAVPGIDRKDLHRILVPVPPVQEQRTLRDVLAQQTETAVHAIAVARHQVDLMREYRSRLVFDVVTGKLDVREVAANLPDDSDADDSALDERLEGVVAG